MTGTGRLRLGIAAVVFVSAVAGRSVVQLQADDIAPRTLEIDVRPTAGTVARLDWSDDSVFTAERSIQVPLQPGIEGFQQLRFPLPASGARRLRFHPLNAAGEIWIADVRLRDGLGRVLATLDPDALRSGQQIASIARHNGVTHVVTTSDAVDPFLIVPMACFDRTSFWRGLAWISPIVVVVFAAVFVALMAACAAITMKEAFDTAESSPSGMSRWLVSLWLAGFFVLVVAAKLLFVREHPLAIPFWDQWSAEGSALYVPFHDCDLGWRAMFSLHNEHRVFFTRLLALTLLIADHQWDPRLQQVANVVLHSLTGVLLVAMVWVAHGRRRLDLLVFVGALIFAAPFAWENTLFGFQSAFYFLLFFSLLAVWLTARYRAGSAPWILGWCCAVCALFTAASGLMAAAVIGVVALLKGVHDREQRGETLATVAIAFALLLLGFALSSPPVPSLAYLKPKSVAQFLSALARNLAWPWIEHSTFSSIMWMPFVLLTAMAAARRLKTTELERFVVGLGLWVLVHAGAMAFGRGGAPSPRPRYMDFLSLGALANTAAFLAILDRLRPGLPKRLVSAGLAVWLVFTTVGVTQLAEQTLLELRDWVRDFATETAVVRKFVATGDRADFFSRKMLTEIPYPDAPFLANLLEEPFIRRVLPAAIRAPLQVEPLAISEAAFVNASRYPDVIPDDPFVKSWSSLSPRGKGGQGQLVSRPLRCQLAGGLKFQVAGYLGWEHQYLALKELKSGRDTSIRPQQIAREAWVETTVACPPSAFEIVAIDAAPDSWFAFREPVEIGALSRLAEGLIGRSLNLCLAAVAMLVLAARWTRSQF
jgi:hypothetical protein